MTIKFGYCPKCDNEHAWNFDCGIVETVQAGYCPKCYAFHAENVKCESVGNKFIDERRRSRQDNVYAKQIWNEAIEAAALIVQPQPHVDEERDCAGIAAMIRGLKK